MNGDKVRRKHTPLFLSLSYQRRRASGRSPRCLPRPGAFARRSGSPDFTRRGRIYKIHHQRRAWAHGARSERENIGLQLTASYVKSMFIPRTAVCIHVWLSSLRRDATAMPTPCSLLRRSCCPLRSAAGRAAPLRRRTPPCPYRSAAGSPAAHTAANRDQPTMGATKSRKRGVFVGGGRRAWSGGDPCVKTSSKQPGSRCRCAVMLIQQEQNAGYHVYSSTARLFSIFRDSCEKEKGALPPRWKDVELSRGGGV